MSHRKVLIDTTKNPNSKSVLKLMDAFIGLFQWVRAELGNSLLFIITTTTTKYYRFTCFCSRSESSEVRIGGTVITSLTGVLRSTLSL